jgi:hypothetical protein
MLEQRPRCAIEHPAEVAAGKGVKARQLFANVGGYADGRSPGRGKVPIEARKNLAKRFQAARQEPMQLVALRRPLPVQGVVGEPVALQHGHLLEMVGQRASGREAAHASSDHQGLPAQEIGHGQLSS